MSAAESAGKRIPAVPAIDATCARCHLVVYSFKKTVSSVQASNSAFVYKFLWASLEMLVIRRLEGDL
jgi:hypothetical protein